MLSGSSPRSTVCSFTKLRINKPAPTSSTSDSATSVTTIALRSRPPLNPPLTPLPESFSGSTMLRRTVCSAGTSPKISAVSIATARLNTSTGTLRRMSASLGM